MPKGHTPNEEVWKQAYMDIENAPHGERAIIVGALMNRWGVSKSTVYRRIAKYDPRPKKSPRAARKYSDELVMEAVKIKESYNAMGHGDGIELSTKAVIDIMGREGIADASELKESSLNGAFRRLGYRLMKPRVRVEAERYCQLWQMDFSRSEHFQLVKALDDGDFLLRVSKQELHYKDPDGDRYRSWICLVVDDHSRAFIARYYPARGEDGPMGIEHLDFIMSRPEDDHPMRHKPEAIRGDQGPFMKSVECMNALAAAGIERVVTEPKNKESQGKVERRFRTIWEDFEARLALILKRENGSKSTIRLSKLNRLMMDWSVACLDKAHPTRVVEGKPVTVRQVLFSSMLKHRPPALGGLLMDAAYKPFNRTAGKDCMVSVNNVQYRAADHAAGLNVEVRVHADGRVAGRALSGYNQDWFEMQPFEFQSYGEFKDTPSHSIADRAKRIVVEEDIDRDRQIRQMGFAAEKVTPKTAFDEVDQAEASEQTLATLIDVLTAFMNRIQTTHKIGDEDAQRWTNGMHAAGKLTRGMTRSEVEALADDFTGKTKMKLTG